ncbi:hypothetical protein [Corynebacterium lubricantis]|nr:hypothetical protein [Corynebacterium lubricantis]
MSKIFGDWRKPEDSLRETLKAYPDPLQAGQDWASRVLAGRGIDARKNS